MTKFNKFRQLVTAFTLLLFFYIAPCQAQGWQDSVRNYGMKEMMPAKDYNWNWREAVFLNAMIHAYEHAGNGDKAKYYAYIKEAMDKTYTKANAIHPNAVASGVGMAFLARISGDKKYIDKSMALYQEYLAIHRVPNGGVSHRVETLELWDDTIYMIGMYLLQMYQFTNDEKYIAEFALQVKAHTEKLADPKTGLWVHGWDADTINYDDHCSMLSWANTPTRASTEFWGRGNGWIAMVLADALNTIPASSRYYMFFKTEFIKITKHLPDLQNKKSGFWYQLPNHPTDAENYEESSCTAMFGYALAVGTRLKVLKEKAFANAASLAYQGLHQSATLKTPGDNLTIDKVCEGTCIGDKNYYYHRNKVTGTEFAVGAVLLFGTEMQEHIR